MWLVIGYNMGFLHQKDEEVIADPRHQNRKKRQLESTSRAFNAKPDTTLDEGHQGANIYHVT